jgi:hypothetical protein
MKGTPRKDGFFKDPPIFKDGFFKDATSKLSMGINPHYKCATMRGSAPQEP